MRLISLSVIALGLVGCAGATPNIGFDTPAPVTQVDAGAATNTDNNLPSNTFDEKGGWATDYVVLIDPQFPAADTENLVSALQAWEDNVPVRFTTWIAVCDKAGAGQICIHNGVSLDPTTRPGGPNTSLTGWTGWTQTSADVYMYVSTAGTVTSHPNVFWSTAEHELGHAQGLVHHPGNVVMNACVNCGETGIVADDANQWLTLRGYPTIPETAKLAY